MTWREELLWCAAQHRLLTGYRREREIADARLVLDGILPNVQPLTLTRPGSGAGVQLHATTDALDETVVRVLLERIAGRPVGRLAEEGDLVWEIAGNPSLGAGPVMLVTLGETVIPSCPEGISPAVYQEEATAALTADEIDLAIRIGIKVITDRVLDAIITAVREILVEDRSAVVTVRAPYDMRDGVLVSGAPVLAEQLEASGTDLILAGSALRWSFTEKGAINHHGPILRS